MQAARMVKRESAQHRRTQAERSEATRRALLEHARTLFAAKGYAGAGREEIVAAAGVTRGALQHHFGDKLALFQAVYEAVEQEVVE
ncbi:MAG TPA: TetR family transcriptional regulator, partial [Acidimicrobiales bacterium]|nr:TetR family transcriptional regulator [Acidimicrobiales bacterium]